jgi:hypothetical protein
MPFADPGDYRDYHRNLFWNRYQNDPEFREDEAARKARWYAQKREEILARMKVRYVAKRKKIKKNSAANRPSSVVKV